MSDLALLNGSLSSSGLRLDDPALTYERFAEICTQLGEWYATVRQSDMALKFAIGDAILYGEEMFGERAYQAFEHFGLSEEVMRECVRVCRAIPHSRRRTGLTWSHHRAVVALPTLDERAAWLKRAREEGLSHHALRAELKIRSGAEAESGTPGRCSCCGRDL